MDLEPPEYEPRDRAAERQERQDRRHGAIVGFAIVVVMAVVLGAGFGCPRDEAGVVSTTTTTSTETTTETTAPGPEPMVYTARLTGGQQIPPVDTSARGTLTLTVAEDGLSVSYVLAVSNLVDVTIGRLRAGAAGEEGEAIITLYDGPKSGSFTGTLIEGTFAADDLGGPLKGKTIEDLVRLIEAGSVYFNLGTSQHKGGEIRGQLE